MLPWEYHPTRLQVWSYNTDITCNGVWQWWTYGAWLHPARKKVLLESGDDSSTEEALDNIQALDQIQGWAESCKEDKIYLGVKTQNMQSLRLEKQIPS